MHLILPLKIVTLACSSCAGWVSGAGYLTAVPAVTSPHTKYWLWCQLHVNGVGTGGAGGPLAPPIIRLHVIVYYTISCVYSGFVDFITDYYIVLFWSTPPNTPWSPNTKLVPTPLHVFPVGRHLTVYYTVFKFYKDRRWASRKVFTKTTCCLWDTVGWSIENHLGFG